MKHKRRLCDKTHSLLTLLQFVPMQDFKFCTCYNVCKSEYFETISSLTLHHVMKSIYFPPGFLCLIISTLNASSILQLCHFQCYDNHQFLVSELDDQYKKNAGSGPSSIPHRQGFHFYSEHDIVVLKVDKLYTIVLYLIFSKTE